MLRPKEVQDRLGVSPPTLRRWSDKFGDFLSSGGAGSTTETGGSVQRRYSDSDVVVLRKVQTLLASGKTYDEVHQALQDGVEITIEQQIGALASPPLQNSSPAIVEPDHPALQIFREALAAKDGQIRALEGQVAAKDETIEALTRELRGKDELIEQVASERDRLLRSGEALSPEALEKTRSFVEQLRSLNGMGEPEPTAPRLPRWAFWKRS